MDPVSTHSLYVTTNSNYGDGLTCCYDDGRCCCYQLISDLLECTVKLRMRAIFLHVCVFLFLLKLCPVRGPVKL